MDNDWLSALLALGMMVLPPFVILFFLHSCQVHQCSLQASLSEVLEDGNAPALTINSTTSLHFHHPLLAQLTCTPRLLRSADTIV